MISTLRISDASRDCDSGYCSAQYADTLSEFGNVRRLPFSGGCLLECPIPGTGVSDGMGCYPLFCCANWDALKDDLSLLGNHLVSVRIVTDPFAELNVADLEAAFPDACYEYKSHFVTDLTRPIDLSIHAHHSRNVRKALRALDVRESTQDKHLLQEFVSHYDTLVRRHNIRGIARFSRATFERQAKVPGFTAFSAYEDDESCGATLWYVSGQDAYYHLGAYSDRGYKLGASYALFWTALEHFRRIGLRWAALGAGAGVSSSDSGLTRFKRGWATHTRPVYFCGRIFQPQVYAQLAAGKSPSAAATGFFPAYRAA